MRISGNIKEISAFVPKTIIKNMEVDGFTQKDKFLMAKTTGIEERRKCTTSTSRMAIEACKHLNLIGVSMVICVTQTPDYKIPGISHLIQDYFKLECGCLDINGACNGFIQGLATAYLYSQFGNVLLVFSENMTSIVNPKDKNSLLFGDGSVAMIIETSKENVGLFELYSDGSRFTSVFQPYYMEMKGEQIFDFAMNEVRDLIFKYERFDYLVLHQSNLFIIKQLARMLNIPKEKLIVNIQRYGNTSGVSIPLALVTEKPVGDLLCVGYGAGLNWGKAKINYKPEKTYYNEG